MRVSLLDSRLGLLNSTTRIPFRYGSAILTRCPQATLQVVVECDGRVQAGFSGDCLPPSWFDKNPAKDFAAQIDDMLRVIAVSQEIYTDAFAKNTDFFATWHTCEAQIQQRCLVWKLPPLLASG